MILDEVQRVPELITAIKKTVDENTRYEEYLKIIPNDLEVRYDKNFAEILAKNNKF